MEIIEWELMVDRLCKKGDEIVKDMSPHKAVVLHHAIGIAGEAGEIIDTIKKHFIYNQPLNRENLIEELGDLDFYMEGLRQVIGVTREECLKHNFEKLHKRYPKGYTDDDAKERLDKV